VTVSHDDAESLRPLERGGALAFVFERLHDDVVNAVPEILLAEAVLAERAADRGDDLGVVEELLEREVGGGFGRFGRGLHGGSGGAV
jgi:hypothetical protein